MWEKIKTSIENFLPGYKTKIGMITTGIGVALKILGYTVEEEAVRSLLIMAPEIADMVVAVGALVTAIGASFKKKSSMPE